MAGQPSIFARIIAGEIPCHRVYENEHVLAFLDVHPLTDGHTLILPKRPVQRFEDLTQDEAAELGRALREVARKVLAATGAPAYNILQNNGREASQEVPHVHFHIVPRRAGDGLGYRWKPQQRTPQELAALADRIQAAP
ncbi:MAG: HIT family protein [Planctomycetota bacterium]